MTKEENPNKRKSDHYDAFISYRHVELDSFVAERLHKMLEHYRIPAKVQERTGKKRIDRVFRDREELPLSADLGENIRWALDHSDFLIVICSPESTQSRWVQSEIDLFLKTHSQDRVLTVLARGEPEEAFPERLCYKEETVVLNSGKEERVRIPVEPLAADVRGGSMSETKKKLRSEFLRIVAPLVSCTYDELRQRRQEYRLKQMAASFVTVSLVLAIVLAQSVMTYRQYRKAEKNQAKYMSEVSGQLLSDGNREEAIRAVMSQIPADQKVPAASEQVYALNNALYSYQYTSGTSFKAGTGTELENLTAEFDENEQSAQNLSPGGKYYLCLDREGVAYVLDGEKAKCLWKIDAEEVNDEKDFLDNEFIWSSPLDDQRTVLLSSNYMYIIDIESKSVESKTKLKKSIDSYNLYCTQNSRYIAIANDGSMQIYSLKTRECVLQKSDLKKAKRLKNGLNNIAQIALPKEDDRLFISVYESYSDQSGIYSVSIKDGTVTTITKEPTWAILFTGKNKLTAVQYGENGFYVSCYNLKTGKKIWTKDNLPQREKKYNITMGMELYKAEVQRRYYTENGPFTYTYRLKEEKSNILAVYIDQYLYCFDLKNGDLIRVQDYPDKIIGIAQSDSKRIFVALSSGEVYNQIICWEWEESDTGTTHIYNNDGSFLDYDELEKAGDAKADVSTFYYNSDKKTIIQEIKDSQQVKYMSALGDDQMKIFNMGDYEVDNLQYYTAGDKGYRCIYYTNDSYQKENLKIYQTGTSKLVCHLELKRDWTFMEDTVQIGLRNEVPILCCVLEKSGADYHRFMTVSLQTGKILGESKVPDKEGWDVDGIIYFDSMNKLLVKCSNEASFEYPYYEIDISKNKWGAAEQNNNLDYQCEIFLAKENRLGVLRQYVTFDEYEGENTDWETDVGLEIWDISQNNWKKTREYKTSTGEAYLSLIGFNDAIMGNNFITGKSKSVFAVLQDGKIHVIDWSTGKVTQTIPVTDSSNVHVQAAFLNNDHALAVMTPDNHELYVYDIKTGEVLFEEKITFDNGELVSDSNEKYFGVKEGESSAILRKVSDTRDLDIYFVGEDDGIYHYADVPYGYASFETNEVLSIPENANGECAYSVLYTFEELCKKANAVLSKK